MLVSKSKISTGDIASFKLNNGDELVAKIVAINDNSYTLSKPCVIVPGQQGIGLMQAMFSVDPDADIELNKQHIMMSAPTVDQLQKHYIKTTTGIEVSASGIIT
jgi:hypothetical protein